jgi:hypothetical protein
VDAALARANVAILLVSADFLASDFIMSVELPSLLQSAEKRGCKVIPVIIGPCRFPRIRNLQRFQAVNTPDKPLEGMRKHQAEEILAGIASAIDDYLTNRTRVRQAAEPIRVEQQAFVSDLRVDRLVAGVKLADWAAAEQAALEVIAQTNPSARNEVFEALLNYQDCSDEDERLWGALHTIECCVRLAPLIITHSQLSRMASHGNFAVRSSAASICMDLGHSAPHHVPLDLAMKLSVYDEDWYVQTPANAGLKAIARTTPEVLRIFHTRLRSSNFGESTHSAEAIRSIADNEPGLLDAELLKSDLVFLKKCGNDEAARHIRTAISKTSKAKRIIHYRYGL